jgi:hypothetical protein
MTLNASRLFRWQASNQPAAQRKRREPNQPGEADCAEHGRMAQILIVRIAAAHTRDVREPFTFL